MKQPSNWVKRVLAAAQLVLVAAAIVCGAVAAEIRECNPLDLELSQLLQEKETAYLQAAAQSLAAELEQLMLARTDGVVKHAAEIARCAQALDRQNIVLSVADGSGEVLWSAPEAEEPGQSLTISSQYRIYGARHTQFYSVQPEEARATFSREYGKPYEVLDAEWDSEKGRTVLYYAVVREEALEITATLDAGLPIGDEFRGEYHFLRRCLPAQTVFEWAPVLCALGILAILVLQCLWTRPVEPDETGARALLRRMDKLPLEIPFLALAALIGVIILLRSGMERLPAIWLRPKRYLLPVCAALAASKAALVLMVSFARRLKGGAHWENTLTHRYVPRFMRSLRRCGSALWRNLPLYWRTALVWLGLCALDFLALYERWFWLWAAEKLLLTPALILTAIQLQRLRKGAEQIRSGELQSALDTRHMLPFLREHGQCLNNIREGMNAAVEEQLRSSRTKDELITNVSHDIKTPLTSIVNYVGLLKKEKMSSPQAEEYLQALERQSARLKKLTEDIVEASKAAAGSIPVEPETLEMNVMLSQTLGEYAQRLEEKGLTAVVREAPEPVTVTADGKLLWRIFDNLLSNITKYSMEQTRIFLCAGKEDGVGYVEFKNISARPLECPPEELLERFVRGDASRNTEGSGLGLSIARSLARLQSGDLRLATDGDLFKATLTLPLSPATAAELAPSTNAT